MATDESEKLRPAGSLEKYSTVRHALGFYFNVAITASYMLPETFTLPLKDYIYKATETLIHQHAILSAIPLGEDTEEPYFARLPEIDLAQPISFQKRTQSPANTDETDSELESLLQAQHSIGFSAPSPYWRLIILTDDADERRFSAAFVYHHAIGDGTSGKTFHRTFLQALRGTAPLQPGEAKQIIPAPKTPLLPNLEALHPLPLSLTYLLKALFKARVYSKEDTGVWTAGAIQTPLKTQLRTIVLSAARTSALIKACRQHGTTVTCVIQTVVARAIFPHVPRNYVRVLCNGAMSSREWLPDTITEDSMGVWFQEFGETYSRKKVSSEAFPWSEAKRSRKTIQKEQRLKSKDSTVGLFKYVGSFREELFTSKIGKRRDKTYEVSSLGAVKTESPEDASLPQMGRVVFSQSASVTGCAFEVSAITGGDGCLVLGITWQAGVVEDDWMRAMLETLKKELHQLNE